MGYEMQSDEDRTQSSTQTVIAQQALEIERLRQQLADERFAEDLRKALSLASAAGTIASPVTHSRLLEMIVETASHVISARSASLFLINQRTQELVFEVALGPKAVDVKKFTVPLGHGIAGLVAVSGQPMAISDAQKDPRFATDIAQRIGYAPDSILCVPLFFNDQVIGVLELFDKEGARSFSAGDMQVLGFFANQAAVAIEQSRTHRNLTALIAEVLESVGGIADHEKQQLQQDAQRFVTRIDEDEAYSRALELARLVQDIVWQGESELKACQAILQSFANYLQSRADPGGALGRPSESATW